MRSEIKLRGEEQPAGSYYETDGSAKQEIGKMRGDESTDLWKVRQGLSRGGGIP